MGHKHAGSASQFSLRVCAPYLGVMFKEEHSMNPSFYKKSLAVLLALFLGLSPQIVLAEEPPVKKSKSGICHAKGSTYYSKTKNYTPYQSMEACLKSGGRRPKR